MTRDDFLKFLERKVAEHRKDYSLSEGKAFGLWYGVDSLDLQEDEAFEAVSFDGGNDKDIDFFFIDQEAERVIIGQLKYNAKGAYKAKKGELLALIHTTDWLKDPEALAREGRKDLAAAAEEYTEAVSQGFAVEYIYVYCGPQHQDIADTARQFNVNEGGGVPSRSCRIVTLDALIGEHNERIDQSTRIAKHSLTLPSDQVFSEKGGFGKALVATISGEALQQLHQKYDDRLFDRNVRLFLGARKGGVNAGIRATLASSTERTRFWAYNNGVTFVCDDFELKDKTLTLHNFSVVNGCQTTVSLATSSPSELKGVSVLARFIAAPNAAIDDIIRYNNSQNPIRVWDLSSQVKLQKRLKKELAALPQPFLYVLRKGELRQLSATERKKFKRGGTGALCQIPHDLNAQYLTALRGKPSIAYKEKGRIFTAFYDEIYPAQIRAEEVVLAWQSGEVCAALVKSELEAAVAGGDEQRVAILKRGAKFFVLATMSVILHQRNGATFLNSIKGDVATSKKTQERLTKYAVVALEWYVELMGNLVSAGGNIASLVRSPDAWLKIHPLIISKWKVFSLAKAIVEATLPKL
jgi:hypothetical protein